MARKPRVEIPGGIFHVVARGNARAEVFIDDADRTRYLRKLGVEVRRHGWHCLSYCLMSNHDHLLVETPQPNLGSGVGRAHGDYAQYFNRRHDRSGHVFQDRFRSVVVRDDAQLWTVTRYVARNPVEAAICSRPEEYPWSSHRHVLFDTAPDWLAVGRLFELFSGNGGKPLERYLQTIEAT